MPPAFVPFFEKPSSPEAIPQPHFNQYKLSTVTVAQSAPRPRHVNKEELANKLLGDLKNAISMSLPEEAVEQILADLGKLRIPERSVTESMDGALEPESNLEGTSEKPSVRLEKDGDKITNIVVECDCGQVIALDCIY